MDTNPLFPAADISSDKQSPSGYVLPQHKSSFQTSGANSSDNKNEAIELIRAKLERIYSDAPDPFEEEQKAESAPVRSKHQQYMIELNNSGRSMAEIQNDWAQYYAGLSDEEKYEVWQEFYDANPVKSPETLEEAKAEPAVSPRPEVLHKPALSQSYLQPRPTFAYTPKTKRAADEVLQPHMSEVFVSEQSQLPTSAPNQKQKKQIIIDARGKLREKILDQNKLQVSDHIHSILFGLGVGFVALIIFLFGFFNEVIVAPFIQPSRNVGATPIIVNPNDVAATNIPEIIIPKIHLEIPTDYSQTSTNEATIETALENGVVHYPSTVMPGQAGNAAFFGHSSNNIFNPGKYKFAFVLLHELQKDDTFYLTYNGKVYVYKVFDKKIVDPSEIGVLNNIPGHAATATLITCDPPGTSLHRLVVVGDQISPDPSGQPQGSNTSTSSADNTPLPGNGPSLWSRLWNSAF